MKRPRAKPDGLLALALGGFAGLAGYLIWKTGRDQAREADQGALEGAAWTEARLFDQQGDHTHRWEALRIAVDLDAPRRAPIVAALDASAARFHAQAVADYDRAMAVIDADIARWREEREATDALDALAMGG